MPGERKRRKARTRGEPQSGAKGPGFITGKATRPHPTRASQGLGKAGPVKVGINVLKEIGAKSPCATGARTTEMDGRLVNCKSLLNY